MSKHKHHIIPRYRCKELGIDPDFDENIVEVDRLDHARIHWGYKCDDLEPLFEYITPAQWIIDLIPRGNNKDVGAAVITAKGEIDGLDASGENNPMYGKKHTEEMKKKLSESRFGKGNPMYGKKHTKGFGCGKNNGMYGKKRSKEWLEKHALGKANSMYGKTGENNPMYGRKHTEDAKKKMSESTNHYGKNNPFYGRKHTEETKRKMSETKAKKKAETQGEGTLKAFLG